MHVLMFQSSKSNRNGLPSLLNQLLNLSIKDSTMVGFSIFRIHLPPAHDNHAVRGLQREEISVLEPFEQLLGSLSCALEDASDDA